MDKMLEKLGLYDFFVRMLTGLIVIVGALLFGMVDTTHLKDNGAVFTAAVLIAGYAIGVVLEEILYIISSILSRKKKDGMKRSKIIDENKLPQEKTNSLEIIDEKSAIIIAINSF